MRGVGRQIKIQGKMQKPEGVLAAFNKTHNLLQGKEHSKRTGLGLNCKSSRVSWKAEFSMLGSQSLMSRSGS